MKQRYVLAALMIAAIQAADAQTKFDFNLVTGVSPYTIVVQPDQKVIIDPVSSAFRVNVSGVADSSFSLTPNSKNFSGHAIYTLAYTESGIYVGGDFSGINGENVTNLARFNPDGTRDKTFSFPFTASGHPVFSLVEQRDGKILVGGTLQTSDGSSSRNIVRLNPDGSLDSSFSAPANAGGGSAFAIAVASDGKIYVGGYRLSRLNADGTLDATFSCPEFNGAGSLTLQPDDKLLAGGEFILSNGSVTNYIERINLDGSIDTSFKAAADSWVYTIALQTDGKMLVGGTFTNLNGATLPGLRRLNPDGSLDETFTAPAYDSLYSIALKPDGKIVAGGSWITNGASVCSAVQFANSGAAAQSLSSHGTSISWLRSGVGPEVLFVKFESSTDGITWQSIGQGARVAGGWTLDNVNLPFGTRIRARGWTAVGQYNTSSTFVETTALVTPKTPEFLKMDASVINPANPLILSYQGHAGFSIVLESSTNLVQWAPLSTNLYQGVPLHYTNSLPDSGARYFRLHTDF